MRKIFLFVFFLFCVSCAGPSSEKLENDMTRAIKTNESFHDIKQTVEIKDQPFIGTERAITLNQKQGRPAFLKDRITLIEPSQNLASLVQRLSSMLPCSVHVAPIPGGKGGGGGGGGRGANSDTSFADPTGIDSNLTMRVNYSGTVEGLLNTIAGRYGLSWEYNLDSKSIEFFKVKTKNFVLLISPGKIDVSAEISNESSISGSTASGESSSSASIEGSQKMSRETKIEPWKAVLESVRTMLSPFGSAAMNESVGTLTVTDMPAILDKVEEYVKEINRKMGRQAAITLTVYSVNITNESSVNLDVAASLKNFGFDIMTVPGSGISALAGASQITGTMNAASVVVPSAEAGSFRHVVDGSNAVFQILSKWA